MHYWLSKPAIMGFRIGAFNVLFEDFNNPNIILSNVTETVLFLEELRAVAQDFTNVDEYERQARSDTVKEREGIFLVSFWFYFFLGWLLSSSGSFCWR